MIDQTRSLRKVHLDDHSITPEQGKQIEQMIKGNPSITDVKLEFTQ